MIDDQSSRTAYTGARRHADEMSHSKGLTSLNWSIGPPNLNSDPGKRPMRPSVLVGVYTFHFRSRFRPRPATPLGSPHLHPRPVTAIEPAHPMRSRAPPQPPPSSGPDRGCGTARRSSDNDRAPPQQTIPIASTSVVHYRSTRVPHYRHNDEKKHCRFASREIHPSWKTDSAPVLEMQAEVIRQLSMFS